MGRINRLFQWGFFAVAMIAAGARSVPDGDYRVEMFAAMAIFAGFLLWAAIGYVYAWTIAIEDLRARRRANAQAPEPRREPVFDRPHLVPAERVEILPPLERQAYWRDSA